MTSKRKSVRKEKSRDVERAKDTVVSESAAGAAGKSALVPNSPIGMIAAVAAAIFVVAHLVLMIGITTPDKIAFDEVHYVPAAKQLLDRGPHEPLLNPMHPPLAKEFMALSIRVFGDNPLGWRYPSAVFGALAIAAMYLCGLALFASQGAALATAALAFLNQMVFVQSRIAMLDIYALSFDLFGIAAFIHGYRQQKPEVAFGLAGLFFGLAGACKWSGFFPLGVEEAYAITADGLFLVGTSEVPLVSLHCDDTLELSQLPIRYAGMSNCFRREAGAHGKDTKGLYRVHQFTKIEQVVFCVPDEEVAEKEHYQLLGNAEAILEKLEIPYRVAIACTGEIGLGHVTGTNPVRTPLTATP